SDDLSKEVREFLDVPYGYMYDKPQKIRFLELVCSSENKLSLDVIEEIFNKAKLWDEKKLEQIALEKKNQLQAQQQHASNKNSEIKPPLATVQKTDQANKPSQDLEQAPPIKPSLSFTSSSSFGGFMDAAPKPR